MFEPFLTPWPLIWNTSPYAHDYSATAPLTIVHLCGPSQDEQSSHSGLSVNYKVFRHHELIWRWSWGVIHRVTKVTREELNSLIV